MPRRPARTLSREIAQLKRERRMPTLDEVCRAIVEARREYANKLRRARREAREKEVIN
jgi:hypothetical protein